MLANKDVLQQDRIFNATQPLTNFEIQKFYQNELAIRQVQQRFHGVYSRNCFPNRKLKNGASMKNLDEYKSIGMHRIAFYLNTSNKKTKKSKTQRQ